LYLHFSRPQTEWTTFTCGQPGAYRKSTVDPRQTDEPHRGRKGGRFLTLTKGLLAFSISSVERIRVANRSR
jgi:hypothetical protein